MAMIGLGAVMFKLKIAKAKGGMFQFIPPKEDLRPVRRRRICDIGDWKNEWSETICNIERRAP